MAINAADLEKLTSKDVQGLIRACEFFYPLIATGKDTPRVVPEPFGISELGARWETSEEFVADILSLTKTGSISRAYRSLLILEGVLSSGETEASSEPEQPASTIPDKIQLDKLVEDYEKAKTEAERERVLEANKNIKFVREFTKVDKIKPEDFKKQILYAEPIEGAREVSLSGTEATAYEKLQESAKKDARGFIEKTSQEIQKNLPTDVSSGLSKEELEFSSKMAASDLAVRLATGRRAVPPEVLASLAASNEVLESATDSAELRSFIKEGSLVFGSIGKANEINIRSFLSPSLGVNFVNYLYGAEGSAFRFTDAPSANTTFSLDLQKFAGSFQSFQGSDVFKLITSNFSDSLKSEMLIRGRGFLTDFISQLPPEKGYFLRLAASSLSSEGFTLLSSFGVEYTATGAFGSFLKFTFPEYLPLLQPLASWMGIDIGITATSAIAAPVAGAGIEMGAVTAGEVSLGAGGAAGAAGAGAATGTVAAAAGAVTGEAAGAVAGAAAGSVVPVAGTIVGGILGFLGGIVGGKLLGKFLSWIKEKIAGNKGAFVGLFGLGVFGLGLVTGIVPLAVAGVLGLGLGIGLAFSLPAAAVIAQGAGMVSGVFFGITSIAIAAISSVAIVSLIAFPVIIAIILFIINSGAYIVPPGPAFIAGVIESPHVGITKTVVGESSFENISGTKTITYQVNIRAKKGTLSNLKLSDACEVTRNGEGPGCPEIELPPYPNIVSPTDAFSFSYSQDLDGNYNDSLIINTITVTADTPDGGGAEALASASVKIGNPPEECPSGWPAHGDLTQGANGSHSHRGAEAIDISMGTGTPVKVTHTGIVAAFSQDSGAYGRHVEVRSSCGGKEYFSRYAHLSVISVKTGQKVSAGSEIGLSGNSGASTGAHLHYEFRYPSGPTSYPKNPPYMMRPYTPKDLPRNCSDRGPCNNVKIP